MTSARQIARAAAALLAVGVCVLPPRAGGTIPRPEFHAAAPLSHSAPLASSQSALHLSSPAAVLTLSDAAVSGMCRNDPVNNFDPLGLAWMLSVQDGRAIVYESGSFVSPKTRGVMAVGSNVEGPKYDYFTAQGSVATTRDRSVIFAHNGRPYEAGIGAFRAALRNIPGDLTKQMLAADAATRQSMLFDFLLTPPESGGAGAKVAAVGDLILSGIAAATSFGGVNYDVSQGGGLFQELAGVDSRGSSYQSIARSSPVVNDAGAALMAAAGAYVGTQQGISLGGDVSARPGQLVAEAAVHGNSLAALGPHDVYVIRDARTGRIYHFGETGRGWETRGAEWIHRLRVEYGLQTRVEFLRAVEGEAPARSLETRYIKTYEKVFGIRPGYVTEEDVYVPIQRGYH